jgi:Spy/CpxP family protein refolding chaperone
MNRLTKILSVAAMTAVLSFAQGRGGKSGQNPGDGPPDPAARIEMRVNMLANLLSLTDAQKAKAIEIFTTAAAANEENRTAMQTARESLAAAVKSNNTAAIDQAARDIGEVTSRSIATESKADAAFYALLTAEQKEKFDALPRRGPGGPGPEGFPGPGPAGFRRGR